MLNLNVGLLGHVDSGKTSLAKVLSQVAGTAAFDRNPQSQARGITLDLGFSSFRMPTPSHLLDKLPEDQIQFSIVDCPGHSSLIRTIIGGAQIIDLILLVVDAVKGIQTQTAECVVIGEITCKNMIVVLNKIDLIEEEKRMHCIEQLKKKIKRAFSDTVFKNAPVISIASNPKSGDSPIGIRELIDQISSSAFIPQRQVDEPFLFAVDHCFAIKGKGTIVTGTVLQGNIKIDDLVDLPAANVTRKVKSMEVFKKPVTSCKAGDRLGICVSQFDPKLMERGIVCTPGLANYISCCVISATRIKYFKRDVNSKGSFHITVGHETAMGIVTCFISDSAVDTSLFDINQSYLYSERLDEQQNKKQYMLIEFDRPVLAVENSKVIGSKLDMDCGVNNCRIAFWGQLLTYTKNKDYKNSFLPTLRIYKNKCKVGIVERLVNNNTVIVKNMFKRETAIDVFIGLKVSLSSGEIGIIDCTFGQSGKIKVYVHDGLNPTTQDILSMTSKSEGDKKVEVRLLFKKYIYDDKKKIVQ